MNHLWDIQETNSQLAYLTHTKMISRACLGSEPGLLRSNKPWGLLNTKVMRHHRKIGFISSPDLKKKKNNNNNTNMNIISGIF